MAGGFTQVARRSLADDVRERLEASIVSGALAPGARLPSEEVLSADFGVSRTSVREAIRELIVLGLVERRGNPCERARHAHAGRCRGGRPNTSRIIGSKCSSGMVS